MRSKEWAEESSESIFYLGKTGIPAVEDRQA